MSSILSKIQIQPSLAPNKGETKNNVPASSEKKTYD